jgi:hypothetical protein
LVQSKSLKQPGGGRSPPVVEEVHEVPQLVLPVSSLVLAVVEIVPAVEPEPKVPLLPGTATRS